MDSVNPVEVFMIVDIVFTSLYDDSTSGMYNMNISKPTWVSATLHQMNDELVFPTFALSVICPFVIGIDGTIYKCSYNKDIEGVEYSGYEMEFVEGICLNTNDGLWDWKEKTSKKTTIETIRRVYGSIAKFRQQIEKYPYDNSLLKSIISGAELEL